jgi:hypothetical protein
MKTQLINIIANNQNCVSTIHPHQYFIAFGKPEFYLHGKKNKHGENRNSRPVHAETGGQVAPEKEQNRPLQAATGTVYVKDRLPDTGEHIVFEPHFSFTVYGCYPCF